jgi:hypothetical protein
VIEMAMTLGAKERSRMIVSPWWAVLYIVNVFGMTVLLILRGY